MEALFGSLPFVIWCNLTHHFGKNITIKLVQLHVYKGLYLTAFAGYPN